jgi:type I restriction enzyme S subunit
MSNYVQLKIAASYVDGKINFKSLSKENFVTVDNLLQNKAGRMDAIGLPLKGNSFPSYYSGDILIGNIRPYLKKIWFADRNGGSTQDVLILRANNGYNPKYLYYSLFRDEFFIHMMNGKKGTKMPRGDRKQVLDFLIPNFTLPTQQRIAAGFNR